MLVALLPTVVVATTVVSVPRGVVVPILVTKDIRVSAFGSSPESQELTLDVDDIVNFCDDTVHLQFERTFVGGVRSGFLSFGDHGHAATTESPPLPHNIIAPDAEMTPNAPPLATDVR